jgi:cobalamin biosynthesis protein CobD/CbiB
VLAGTGGGVLADLIVGVPPVLFRPGLLLGVASALGTSIYVVGTEVTDQRALWFVVGVVAITSLRVVSIATGWGVGSVHELTERSEAMFERLPRWSELQRPRRGAPESGSPEADTPGPGATDGDDRQRPG